MAVAGLVLHFLTGRDDIVLGSPFVNRPSFEDRQVIGLFLEPLPVRISVKHENENEEDADLAEAIAEEEAGNGFDDADQQAPDQGARDRSHAAETRVWRRVWRRIWR